jgi:3-dehydroquinate dehydratase-2
MEPPSIHRCCDDRGLWEHRPDAPRAALPAALPAIEVHISNIYKREEFRHKSLTAPVCTAVISGLGLEGYFAAVRFLLK